MGQRRRAERGKHFAPLSIALISVMIAFALPAIIGGCARPSPNPTSGTATAPPDRETSVSLLPATTTTTSTPTSSPTTTTTSSPLRPLRVAAWSRGDTTSLANATDAGALDEVDLDWWHCRADGTLVPERVSSSYVANAHAKHVAVFATITNRPSDRAPFDPAIAEGILATASSQAKFAAKLVRLCEQRAYDGIELDFESLQASDRESYSAFVALLAARLHAEGKLLSIAVYDKDTDYPTGPEAGARAAEDYQALGDVVDEFKVLTFGEHGSFTAAGPLSSPAWMNRVLTYAESQVDPAKIWLGVPFYGFDWGNGVPRYLRWHDAQVLVKRYHAAVRRSSSGEAYFHYTAAKGVAHTVYFQDRTAVKTKLRFALARRPAIAGIAIWVMGGEDPGFWPTIGGLLR